MKIRVKQKMVQTECEHCPKKMTLTSLGEGRRRWTPVAPHRRPIHVWGIVRGIRDRWLIRNSSLSSVSKLSSSNVNVPLLQFGGTMVRTWAFVAPAKWTNTQITSAAPLGNTSIWVTTRKIETGRASSLRATRTRRIIPGG